MKIQFGDLSFDIPRESLADIPKMLKASPGKVLTFLESWEDRISWFAFYSDGTEVFCGFRKSTSSTFHFFALDQEKCFSEHHRSLRVANSLTFQRKRKGQAKGPGSKSKGMCTYRGEKYPTHSKRLKMVNGIYNPIKV